MNPQHQIPPAAQMMEILMGRWLSHAIGVAAKLGFADQLASGPKTAEEIAKATSTHAPAVFRVLRALASRGIFTEQEPGRFANTPLSDTLREGVAGSSRSMALFINSDVHVKGWLELEHCVRTGASGFQKAHGMKPWEFVGSSPEFARLFNDTMTGLSAQTAPLVAMTHDFSQYETLVDVGGGHGLLMTTILEKNPTLKGIVFDLPPVVEGAKALVARSTASARCQIVGGDFFKEVPTGDAYVMKSIIHDWNDDDAIKIMKTIHRAAKPGAKLLLVESVIRPGNDFDIGKFIDLEMLVATDGGRERTEKEFAALYERGGFRLEKVTPTPSPMAILEGVRV